MPATTRMYQAYSGMRLSRMPGGRHFSTPTISSTAAALEATSMNDSPSIQMSAPMPASDGSVASGGYMNQPPSGAASKKIEPQTNTPPIRTVEEPQAERRGNGRPRGPSSGGSRRMETASSIGTAKGTIITEPGSVKSWLKVEGDTRSLSGSASWARISSARSAAKSSMPK